MEAMGREFLEKLSAQDINVQNISGAALSGLVASGEVPLSPTIFNSNIFTHKQSGAPVEWRPLDPVVAGVGTSGMVVNSPHPYAALLFLDYLHSKIGQEAAMKGGLSSARKDIGSLEQKFKKIYIESKYTPEEFEKKYNGKVVRNSSFACAKVVVISQAVRTLTTYLQEASVCLRRC